MGFFFLFYLWAHPLVNLSMNSSVVNWKGVTLSESYLKADGFFYLGSRGRGDTLDSES